MSATRTQTVKPERCPDRACVVKVGGGRGFVVEYNYALKVPSSFKRGSRLRLRKLTQRFVITAAHCLPTLPPAHAASYASDRTYLNFLGTLDTDAPTVAAECLFADPVADIAVLGPPDNQEFGEEADGFEELMEASPTVRIGSLYRGHGAPGTPITRQGWMMSLAGQWIPTVLKVHFGFVGRSLETDATVPGMSGSPILNSAGMAVGLVSLGAVSEDPKTGSRTNERAGRQPILVDALPGWLLG